VSGDFEPSVPEQNRRSRRRRGAPRDDVRIVFLGGLGEIGRNCAVVESDGRLLVIDCGLMFPDNEMPGVDLVLPDLSYLVDRAHKIDGIVLTHGHEDHVGALSYLLRDVDRPIHIYGSRLCLSLCSGRLEESGVADRAVLHEMGDGEVAQVGGYTVEFIAVTHSVPFGHALAIGTPQGTIIHTGDYKLDPAPVDDRRTDLGRFGELGRQGVRLMLGDSTNAEVPGYTGSESSVGVALVEVFDEFADFRIVAASFASHLHRVKQVVDVAVAQGRKIAFLGRSMIRNVGLAREQGILPLSDADIITIEEVYNYPPNEVVVICTGSQGEAFAALSLLSSADHRALKLGDDDAVIISATPIPGNESNVNRVINNLNRLGVRVIHSGGAPVHVSGHAAAAEIKALLEIVKPEAYVPVHGEYRHMVANEAIAADAGVPTRFLCLDGDAVVLADEGISVQRRVAPHGYVYVDGIIDDVGPGLLHDRRHLSEEGLVVAIVMVDGSSGEILGRPQVVTRGWVHADESGWIIEEATDVVAAAVEALSPQQRRDVELVRRRVRRAIGGYVDERTRRRPPIVPVVMEV